MSQAQTWKCEVCGYVHEGDAAPESCPVCGVGADLFSPFVVASEVKTKKVSEAWRCVVCDHVEPGDQAPSVCPVCGATADLFEPFVEDVAKLKQSERATSNLVIVGGGIAGVCAAEHARKHAGDVKITMIMRESESPYYRINLTRLLAGEIAREDLRLKAPSWYQQQRIDIVVDEVVSIDRQEQLVRLRHGADVSYDRLVLANGAHPFVPPISGVTRAGVHPLRTVDDVDAVLARAKAKTRCVCIGGGLLGLEAAGALAKHGLDVSVLEGFGWLLPRQLAPIPAKLLAEHLQAKSMRVRCDVQVKAIVGDESVAAVVLASGEEIEADIVVLATGVRSNSYLARQAGLQVKNGIVVDDFMATSDAKIFAAGDVAEHRGLVHGIWPTAFAQGAIAGANAMGAALLFAPLAASNRLKVLDVDLFSIGRFMPDDASDEVHEWLRESNYARLLCRDGKIVGANLYGHTSMANLIKNAIEAETPLAELGALFDQLQDKLGPALSTVV